MAILIYDPVIEAEVRRLRACYPGVDYDEVWEGVTVVSPQPNIQHQDLTTGLMLALAAVVREPGLGRVFGPINLSDRADGWTHNYREPDLSVYLTGNPAIDRDTHMQGGPDLLIEIISPGEDPYAKLDFYARVNTREVLLIHRDPWAAELFRLAAGTLTLVGRADEGAAPVTSDAVGLTFAVTAGPARPVLAVTHPATGRTWAA